MEQKRTQIKFHIVIATCVLTKIPKIYIGKKIIDATNYSAKTGFPLKNETRVLSCFL